MVNKKKPGSWNGEPGSLLFLSYPVHICCTHVNPCGSERRGPSPSLHSPPLFSLPELTVGTIKTLKREGRGGGAGGKRKKAEEQEEGSEILQWCAINHKHSGSSNSPASITEPQAPLQSPTVHVGPQSLHTIPTSAPLPSPQLRSSSDPFAHFAVHQHFGQHWASLSLYPQPQGPFTSPSDSHSPRGHRDFSSPGATFTLATG